MHTYILIRCKWGELVDLEVTCHSRGMGSHMKWIFVFLFPFFQRWSRDPAPDLLKYLILIYWTNGTTIRDDWQWNRRLAYIRAWLLIVMSPEKRWMIWKAGIIAEWSYALTLGMRRNVMQSISSHFSSVFRCFAFDFGFYSLNCSAWLHHPVSHHFIIQLINLTKPNLKFSVANFIGQIKINSDDEINSLIYGWWFWINDNLESCLGQAYIKLTWNPVLSIWSEI